jgi:hypothetical protein
MKKIIQVLVYGLWGLIALLFGLSAYNEIYEPGIGFWSGTLTAISATLMILVALLALSWAALSMELIRNRLLPRPKYKYVNNYTVPCLLIILVTMSNVLGSSASTMQGKELGFLSVTEFSDAKRNKIFDANEYSKYLVEKEAKDKADEERRIAEEARVSADNAVKEALLAKKKQEEKAQCFEDAYCYYKNNKNSEYACIEAIPKISKYKFEWTDSWSESKFDRTGWYDKPKHIVRISGDKATAQNGFGATKNITYYCIFNADTGEIIDLGFL